MTMLDAALRLLPSAVMATAACALIWYAARYPRTPEGVERAFWLRARRRYWKRRAK